MFRERGVEIKTREQIELMRAAGLVVGRTLDLLRRSVRPGLSTLDLDRLAEEHIRDAGAVPSFLGYSQPPYPASLCVSVNDEVVHGIPGGRVLRDGDLVSIDCGAIVDGWHGDSAITLPIGEIGPDARELLRVTEEAMWRGIGAARVGGRLGDVSAGVQDYCWGEGDFGIVPDYTGHGIGTAMHQPPSVPNLGRAGRGMRLVEGLVLAVEPMVVLGSPATHTDPDGWTVRTDDGSLSAHFEHTVALLADGLWVLTALDGGRADLARLGVPYAGT